MSRLVADYSLQPPPTSWCCTGLFVPRVSSRVSLKVSYGVLVAVLDRGTGWEVQSRVWTWVSLVVSDRGCGRKVLQKVSLGLSLKVS